MTERSPLAMRPDAAGGLRAGVLTLGAVLVASPFGAASGVAAAGLGALAAALLADAAARTRLRTASVFAAAALAGVGGVGLARLLVATPPAALVLGAVGALHLAEAVRWLFLVAPVVFAVRLLVRRRPTAAVLELALVGSALVAALAAHRNGMVHRPLALGDWAWSRGLDPALVFLALGAACVVALALLLVRESRARRIPLHLSALGLIALLLLVFVRLSGLPQPRPPSDLGLTGEPEDAKAEQKGESGEGSQSDLQLSDLPFKNEYRSNGGDAPVAVVLLHDEHVPPTGVYYFRQTAFSQYNGQRLVQATRDDVDRDVLRGFPTSALRVPEAPPLSESRAALRTTMGLLVDHVKPFALDSPVRIGPTPNPSPVRFQRTFEVLSHVRTLPYEEMLGARPGRGGWSREQWRHYTEAPLDPRYAERAGELQARLREEYRTDPLAQAIAIKSYLDRNGIYSRKSRHAGVDDPTGSFLFGDLTGYCVHFAHAAVYLMRSLGLPARVAAGYAVPESDRGDGSAIMIRGLNAHAWPELYLEGVGWVVIDPTPERTLDQTAARPDPALQRMLGEMLRAQRPPEPLPDDPLRTGPTLGQVARALAWALLLAALAGLAVKAYRAVVPRLAAPGERPRVVYRAALDRLAEVGATRRYGESRERFAARQAAVTPSFAGLTRAHLRAALGRAAQAARERDAQRGAAERSHPAAGELGELERLSRAVRTELRRCVPSWRRAAGALDPTSWLRAR